MANLADLQIDFGSMFVLEPTPAPVKAPEAPEIPSGQKPNRDIWNNPTNIGGLSNAMARNVNATVQPAVQVPCTLHSIQVSNGTAAACFVQIFFRPDNVILGTGRIPDLEIQVAANSFEKVSYGDRGVKCPFGISLASTTATAGTTGSADGVQVTMQYDPKTGEGD